MGIMGDYKDWKELVLMLKGIAKKNKKTHQDIADETGLHRSNVTRFFGLKYCPRLDTFMLIYHSLYLLPDNKKPAKN